MNQHSRITLFFLQAAILLFLAAVARAQGTPDPIEMIYGPGIEIGGGAGFNIEGEETPWNSKNYNLGLVTASIRIFQGLSIQGGMDYGKGKNSDADTLTYGDYRLQLNKKTFISSYWAGLRYEIPMSMIGKDIMAIHSVYCAVGMTWADYGVQSSKWTYRDESVTNDNTEQFKVVRFTGPYIMAAARWRIDRQDAEAGGSWLGSYGVDLGVRYSRLGDHTIEHPNIPAPSDDYTSTQIFLTGFIKIKLFE